MKTTPVVFCIIWNSQLFPDLHNVMAVKGYYEIRKTWQILHELKRQFLVFAFTICHQQFLQSTLTPSKMVNSTVKAVYTAQLTLQIKLFLVFVQLLHNFHVIHIPATVQYCKVNLHSKQILERNAVDRGFLDAKDQYTVLITAS